MKDRPLSFRLVMCRPVLWLACAGFCLNAAAAPAQTPPATSDAQALYRIIQSFELTGGTARVENLTLKRDRAQMTFYRLEYSIAQEGDAYFIKGTVFQDGAPAGESWFMPLPLVVKLDGDKVGRALVYALGPETPVNFRIGSKPRSVELDPDMWVLSEKTTTKAVK